MRCTRIIVTLPLEHSLKLAALSSVEFLTKLGSNASAVKKSWEKIEVSQKDKSSLDPLPSILTGIQLYQASTEIDAIKFHFGECAASWNPIKFSASISPAIVSNHPESLESTNERTHQSLVLIGSGELTSVFSVEVMNLSLKVFEPLVEPWSFLIRAEYLPLQLEGCERSSVGSSIPFIEEELNDGVSESPSVLDDALSVSHVNGSNVNVSGAVTLTIAGTGILNINMKEELLKNVIQEIDALKIAESEEVLGHSELNDYLSKIAHDKIQKKTHR